MSTGRRAEKIAVPGAVRSRVSLARVDYRDAFAVRAAEPGSGGAEPWIRAVFESAPAFLRTFLRLGWSMFGARLGPRDSPAHVLGWRIAESRPDWIRLEVDWKVGLRANLVLQTAPSPVVLATFVEHRRRASRILWPALVPAHQVTLRYLLTRAASSQHPQAVRD